MQYLGFSFLRITGVLWLWVLVLWVLRFGLQDGRTWSRRGGAAEFLLCIK